MSSLHTISRSPGLNLLASCTSVLAPDDAILLVEDGTYYSTESDEIQLLVPDIALYVLKEDVTARGIAEQCAPYIKIVDYTGYVRLCCEFDRVINWF